MQSPSQYRKYAEECRRLAQMGSREHRAALLEMAEAWTKCAEELEALDRSGKRSSEVLSGGTPGS